MQSGPSQKQKYLKAAKKKLIITKKEIWEQSPQDNNNLLFFCFFVNLQKQDSFETHLCQSFNGLK